MNEEYQKLLDETPEVDVSNAFGLVTGENLPNHSFSLKGLSRYVAQAGDARAPLFRTQQEAFRYAAWLVNMAEYYLPNEEVPSSFDEVREAVRIEHLEATTR